MREQAKFKNEINKSLDDKVGEYRLRILAEKERRDAKKRNEQDQLYRTIELSSIGRSKFLMFR